jgi:hypothetical protein
VRSDLPRELRVVIRGGWTAVLSGSGARALALLAVVCAAAGSGGGTSRAATGRELVNKAVREVTTVRLTRRIPAHVRTICAATRRAVRIRVLCPPLVPLGGVVTDPGLSYSNTYRNVTDFYAMTFNNGEIPGKIHWVVGAGTPARFRRHVLSSRTWDVKGPVRKLGNARYRGRDVTLYRFPLDPAGALLGTHIVAMTRMGRLVLFASVHGYGHRDADIAMVVAMAEHGAKRNPRSR